MKPSSRRTFLWAALGSSMLGASASTAAGAVGGSYDVVIVGAGAAGIGAGTVLQAARKKFLIVEARNRTGGRTFTDTRSFPGIPWDQGGQWLHQSTPQLANPELTNNPLTNIARARRIPVAPDLNPRLLLRFPQAPVNMLNSPVLPTLGVVATEILTAGLVGAADPRLDLSSAQATADVRNLPWYTLIAGLLQTQDGATLEELGAADFFNLSETGVLPVLIPSFDNWLIPSGLGSLVTSLARGMTISTNTPVTEIQWGTGQGVAVRTSKGTISAKSVIVTAPLGTLASGNPRFTPELPPAYLTAIHGLRMGHTAKVGMLFAPNFAFDVPKTNTFVMPYVDREEASLVQTRAFGHKNFAIFIIGGAPVAEIERRGELIQYALDGLVEMFGSRLRSAFRKGVASSWNTSPYTLGGYSYAPAGAVPYRAFLGEPLANRVFFAGEALSVISHSSAHGAYLTGRAAAEKAIRVIG